MAGKFRYGEMSWPEIGQAAKENRVAVVPVATIEDHGPHLPVDTDVMLCTTICSRAAELVADEIVLVPPVLHGYSPHHMDFPGPITIGAQTFIQYMVDACKSLAHHNFRRILMVNGHGSNTSLLDIVARLTIMETEGEVLCAAVPYWNIGKLRDAASKVMTSGEGAPGHAGEFETSLYLAIKPELVNMSKAPREFPQPGLRISSSPNTMATVWPFWSAITESGIMGDASVASKEKGQAMLEAAVTGLAELIKEFRAREFPRRIDHHG